MTDNGKHIDLLIRLVDSTLESIDNDRLARDLERAKGWLLEQPRKTGAKAKR